MGSKVSWDRSQIIIRYFARAATKYPWGNINFETKIRMGIFGVQCDGRGSWIHCKAVGSEVSFFHSHSYLKRHVQSSKSMKLRGWHISGIRRGIFSGPKLRMRLITLKMYLWCRRTGRRLISSGATAQISVSWGHRFAHAFKCYPETMCQLGTVAKASMAPDRNGVGRHSHVRGVEAFKRTVKMVFTRIVTRIIPTTVMVVGEFVG